MPTNYSYWNNIVHMTDEKGVLCNAHVGDTQNSDKEKVNCNKCIHFMADSKALEISRKQRKKREEEKKKAEAAEAAGQVHSK